MKFDEIKKHANFPFRNFQQSDLEFLMLELYWATLFQEVVGESARAEWKAECPADRDQANPILFLSNRTVKPLRIIRIIQRFNEKQLPEINLETFDDLTFEDDAYVPFVPDVTIGALDQDMVTPIDELVVSSDISPVCERYVQEYIGFWCVDLCSIEEMQDRLEIYWNEVNSHLFRLDNS